MNYPIEFISRKHPQVHIHKMFSRNSYKKMKMRVLESFSIGHVFYTEGDTIQVFHFEYLKLMKEYPTYFKVITS